MVRIKHRYLLVNILYPDPNAPNVKLTTKPDDDSSYSLQFRRPSSDELDGKVLMRLIRNGVAELFGDYGAGKVAGSLQVKYFSPATSTAIIRVSREHYRLVWAALTFTTRLPVGAASQPCVFQVVRVSGTIRKAEEEAIRRARISIRRARRQAKPRATDSQTSGAVDTIGGAVEEDDYDLVKGIEDPDEPGDPGEDSDEAG